MKEFLSSMFSGGSEVSIKRFIGFLAFIVLIFMVIGKGFFKMELEDNLIYTFAGIVAGVLGLTTIEKFKSN